jgi:integrase
MIQPHRKLLGEEDTMTTKTKKRQADRDGVYKRRGYWHFDYKDPQTGRWRSKTSGTTVYNDAKTVRKQFLESLIGNYDPSNDRMRFADAALAYMEHRKVSVAAGTVTLETERLVAVNKLLSRIAPPELKLKDFDLRLLRGYQQSRIAEGAGPRTVNMEGQVIRSILKYHEQWKLDGKYEPLPEPESEAGRALTPEEEVRLIDVAKSCPRWNVAYHATVLENETGMRGVEIRKLQVKSVCVDAREIRLPKRKTKARVIALSPDALESAKALLLRARALGAVDPDHYLLPAFVNTTAKARNGKTVRARRFEPTLPTTGWRTAWRKLTLQAGLARLRGHDLRHNWVTAHAEIGTPQSVLEAQAGHLSKRMSDHYKHVSEGAAHKASDELARVKEQQRKSVRAATELRKTTAASKPPVLLDQTSPSELVQ